MKTLNELAEDYVKNISSEKKKEMARVDFLAGARAVVELWPTKAETRSGLNITNPNSPRALLTKEVSNWLKAEIERIVAE